MKYFEEIRKTRNAPTSIDKTAQEEISIPGTTVEEQVRGLRQLPVDWHLKLRNLSLDHKALRYRHLSLADENSRLVEEFCARGAEIERLNRLVEQLQRSQNSNQTSESLTQEQTFEQTQDLSLVSPRENSDPKFPENSVSQQTLQKFNVDYNDDDNDNDNNNNGDNNDENNNNDDDNGITEIFGSKKALINFH